MSVLQETGADGIMVDLEGIARNTGPELTALLKELSSTLQSQSKLVMTAVMSRTSDTAEPWCRQYEYAELAKYTDYIQIMAYDYSYAGSGPGPVAPLKWVEDVIRYAVTKIPPQKILLGIPSYGRSWSHNGSKWVTSHMSMAGAIQTATKYGVPLKRDYTRDPVGTPTFTYRDQNGIQQTTYFDDSLSWNAKLQLIDRYNLGGSSIWSMHWLDAGSAPVLYALLKKS